MITHIGTINVWCDDQEAAVAFWTEQVGFEVRTDVTLAELGDFRWVTVGPPGQPDVQLTLQAVPGPPVFEPDTQKQVRETVAKGATGGVFFMTEDCRATYEELSARGVEFTELPEERPYGIDAGFRDPSGNRFRLTQLTNAA